VKMLDKINLGLLIITIMIWAGIQQLEKPKLQGHAIFSIATDDILAIKSTKNNQLKMSLDKGPHGWSMTHPKKQKAVTKRVNLLLALSKARSEIFLDARQIDLSSFGFKEKNLSIHFNQTKLLFGGVSEPSSKRYIQVDNSVYLIDDSYYRMAGLAVSNYLKPLPEQH